MSSSPIPILHPALQRVTNIRLIHPSEGHSVRRVMPGSGATGVVSTPSYRYREGHAVEGLTEWLLEKHDEVVKCAADSRPQPLTVVGVIDGVIETRATPDRARLLRDGTRQLVECKPNWAAFFTPKATIQRLLTEAAAASLGWDYLPITPGCLGTPTFKANVARIYGCRSVHVPDRVAVMTTRLLAKGPMKLGDLAAQLDDREVNGFSMVCAMMVRRIVEIGLDEKLGHSSMVRIMEPMPRGLPSIRFRRRGG